MYFHSLGFLTRRFGNVVLAPVPTVSSPLCNVPAIGSEVSLPADLAEVSVESLCDVIGISRGIPGGSEEPVKANTTVCASDDLDVTLGALARQLSSFFTDVPRGGESCPPSPKDAALDSEKQQGTSGSAGGELQKSSPQFSGFVSGFGRTLGAQGTLPKPKRGKRIIWLGHYLGILALGVWL